jgi:hypothetical protein
LKKGVKTHGNNQRKNKFTDEIINRIGRRKNSSVRVKDFSKLFPLEENNRIFS